MQPDDKQLPTARPPARDCAIRRDLLLRMNDQADLQDGPQTRLVAHRLYSRDLPALPDEVIAVGIDIRYGVRHCSARSAVWSAESLHDRRVTRPRGVIDAQDVKPNE